MTIISTATAGAIEDLLVVVIAHLSCGDEESTLIRRTGQATAAEPCTFLHEL
jgi:hypothetical protein